MPPLAVDAHKTRMRHRVTQQLAVGDMFMRDLAAFEQLLFQCRMRLLAQVIETGSHIQLAAGFIKDREIERHAERVDRTTLRVGQVHAQVGAFERVPELLLHALRAQCIKNQRLVPGPLVGQPCHDFFQRGCRVPVQPCTVERRVQVAADEVVGRAVA